MSWGMKPCKLVNNGVSQDVVALIFRVRIVLSEESMSSCVKKTRLLPHALKFF